MLRASGIGCHILSIFLAAIMFADDLALLAPTRGAMQELIVICDKYCSEYCLTFNAKKTKSMIFGDGFTSLDPELLVLKNEPIEYVDEWTYLGCLIQSGKQFGFSCKDALRSFRSSVNSMLSAIKKPNEQVLLQLLYSNCVPILSYAAEVKQFSYSDMHNCHVALNNAIRRIFGYNRWESIRDLRKEFGYNDLYSIFAMRRHKFESKLSDMKNQSINALSRFLNHQLS